MRPLLFVIAMSCVACMTVETDDPTAPIDPNVPGKPTTQGDPSDPTPPSQARQYFDAKVYPILTARCATCHTPTTTATSIGFIAADPNAGYDIVKQSGVVGDASVNAPIVKLSGGPHPTYTMEEKSVVLEWLRLEREGL